MAAAVAAVVVLAGTAGIAAAKGPALVTLTGPGIDHPIEITPSDGEVMTSLFRHTGLWGVANDRLATEPTADELGPAYTVSWTDIPALDLSEEEGTIHQYVFAHTELGLVIHTPDQNGLAGWGDRVIGWFAAPDGLQSGVARQGQGTACGSR